MTSIKKPDIRTQNKKRLNKLLVRRSIEKTDAYNTEIEELQRWFDFMDWGACMTEKKSINNK